MIAAASSKKKTSPRTKEYPRSLMGTVILWILGLSLLPVLVIGVVTYLQTRTILTDQANAQLRAVIDNNIGDLEQFSQLRRSTLDTLVATPQVKNWIDTIANPAAKPTELQIAQTSLVMHMQSLLGYKPEPVFDEIFLINHEGEILAATNSQRYGKNYFNDKEIRQMMGVSRTGSVYNIPGLFTQDFVWLMSSTYQSPITIYQYTLIGAIHSPLVESILAQGQKHLAEGHMYLFSKDETILGVSNNGNLLGFQNNRGQAEALRSVLTAERMRANLNYSSYGDVMVLSYARWIPDLEMGLVLEVPEDTVFNQLRYLTQLYIAVFVVCILLAAGSMAIGTRAIVRPILALVNHVRSFAQGEFASRAVDTRKDELGLLAHSFNQMADQLGEMYRALEQKVEERNRQLLTASEIAQVTSSTTSRKDILKQTVALITERFEYDYACIYLLDPTGSSFAVSEMGGRLSEQSNAATLNQRIRTQSDFGNAITHNQVIVHDGRGEDGEGPETLLSKAHSEAIIPISAGNQVMGLMDVQSSLNEAFNPDTVNVLKMVATQVANGLQNIQLLESTKIDLQETNLLYRASRQVTRVTGREQIGAVINETIAQTPYLGLIMEPADEQLRATSLIDPNNTARAVPVLIVTLAKITAQVENKSHILFDNLNQPGDFFPILNFFSQKGCSQVAVLPVRVAGTLTKIILLGSREKGFLTDSTLQPFLSLVEVIANTEERFSMLQSLEDNLTELKTVSTISEALSVETDLQVLFGLLHDQVVQTIGGQINFYVALKNEETGMIDVPYYVENGTLTRIKSFPFGEGLTSILLQRGEPLLLSRNAVQQAAAMGVRLVGIPARSWVGVPLILGGKAVGVMAAEDANTDGRFTQKDLRLLTTLAPQVTVAIRNAQMLTQMQQALQAYDQEQFLINTLLDKIPDLIYFKDTQGRFIRGSQSQLNLLGLKSQAELVGRTEPEIAGMPEFDPLNSEELAILTKGTSQEGIIECYRGPDGSAEWNLVSRMPMVNDNGEVIGLLAIQRDITGLKQAEELAQKRAQQLRTASEIARDTSGTRNVEELLTRAVNLIRDRFGFYHASIFLLDALNEYAVLRESTGEAGRRLKEAGHRLAVGSQSIVGTSVSRGEALVVNNVTQDPNYYPNPLLPDTRAELAIPLRIGDQILGAIDVQSTTVNAFSPDDISILQTLADQLSIAITNANLFAITQENLAKHRFLHQISTATASCSELDEALKTTVNGLITALGNERVTIYLAGPDNLFKIRAYSGYEDADLERAITPGEGIIGLAALGRHPILVRDTQNDSRCAGLDERVRSLIAVPILYSDRTVGVLNIESSRVAAFDENDQEILGSMGNNLGSILANTQLVAQVRQQVEQQKNLFDITSKIRRSTDIETVMQTSVREICRAVNARRARIQITIGANAPGEPALPGSYGQNGNGHHGREGHHGSNGHHGREGHKDSQEAA